MTASKHRTGFSLRWQIGLLTALIGLMSLTSLGLIAFWLTRDTVIDLTLDKLLAETTDAVNQVERILDATRADVVNVPGFPPIPGIVRTRELARADADGSTTKIWIDRLTQILTAQMKTYSERLHSAVLSPQGEELMRVERLTGNRFALAGQERLDNHADTEFLVAATSLAEGQVFVSRLALDDDGKPSLHVATPYVESGEVKAVFVVKLDGKALVQAAGEQITVGSTDIVDDRGIFVFSDDAQNRTFDTANRYAQRYPVRAQRMQNTEPAADAFSAYISGSERSGEDLVGIYKKIYLNADDRSRFLAIAPSIRSEEALEPVSRLARLFGIVGIIVLLASMAITFFATSGLTRALRKLALAADHIASGTLDAELPRVQNYGEVGALTESFGTMTRNLRSTIAQVSEQDARTRAVLNATADAVITIEPTGIIQTFNASAQKLFGYDAEEVIGKNVSLLAPSPYREEHDSYLSRYHQTGEAHIIGTDRELEGQRKNGTTFPLSLRVTELSHADEQVFIGTVQDITQRKQAEHERDKVADAIRDAVNRLAAASHQILATTAEQATGTQQQAAAVTESVATVEQLAQTADQAATRADAVADAARKSEEVGAAGADAVQSSVTAMRQVKEQVESIAESILALAEKAQTISEITATVREIAEQTNVLALNASVEASRAGEHGKGFAIVAAEVKSLAQDSKKATGQVRQILEEIQQATNNAVLSTEQGTRTVSSAAEVVQQAGETIGVLSETLANSVRSAVQISAAANQQAAGVVQLNQGMKQIDQVTRQNATATQEIEQAAQNLTALSNELASLTSLASVN